MTPNSKEAKSLATGFYLAMDSYIDLGEPRSIMLRVKSL